MSAFFIVEASSGYYKHWAAADQAIADFLRLYHEGEEEDVSLRFSS